MNAIILLLFAAADPTGLQAAFESAQTADLSYDWSGFKVTLVNPETIKKLGPLVEVKGEPSDFPASSGFATHEIIRLSLHGKKTTQFYVGKNFLVYDEKLYKPADDKLWVALRAYFEPPALQAPPQVEVSVDNTFAAAMKGADKLEIFYREAKMEMPINESGKEQTLGFLKRNGDVTQNAKEPKDAVEIVFVNKETRISIYLIGDTAFWGDKHWKSMKLVNHHLWRQMVGIIPKNETSAFPAKPK